MKKKKLVVRKKGDLKQHPMCNVCHWSCNGKPPPPKKA